MATAKVTINNRVIMDITDTTATASTIVQGYTAYGADGVKVTGTHTDGGTTINNQDKSVTPSESQQTVTADSGYTGLGTVTVGAISTTYVGSGIDRKAAATITPGTSNQTIAAGTYLTGTQTIAGDADLVAGNIKSGVQIFGVTGNLSFITYYTGTSDPSSSLGSNGDIYLKVS